MLEEIGRYVIWQASPDTATPDWSDEKNQVTAVFPELVNRDVTKFAAAMASVVTAVIQMIDAGLLTEETGLKLVADVAQRFGQDFDAKTDLEEARKGHQHARTSGQRKTPSPCLRICKAPCRPTRPRQAHPSQHPHRPMPPRPCDARAEAL